MKLYVFVFVVRKKKKLVDIFKCRYQDLARGVPRDCDVSKEILLNISCVLVFVRVFGPFFRTCFLVVVKLFDFAVDFR